MRKIWHIVKPTEHADEVLQAVDELGTLESLKPTHKIIPNSLTFPKHNSNHFNFRLSSRNKVILIQPTYTRYNYYLDRFQEIKYGRI